jgi:septum formation protein
MNRKLILASASPRRKKLLNQLGLRFTIIPSKINEEEYSNLPPIRMVKELAMAKAKAVGKLVEDTVIIAGDTIVLNDGDVLGKPKDKEDAAIMLKKLSGKSHTVLSGLAVLSTSNNKIIVEYDRTEVLMSEITDDEIKKYINTGEPIGKAGSYAIQGLGGIFVEKIDGSYFTVMGLPIHKLQTMLNDFSISVI